MTGEGGTLLGTGDIPFTGLTTDGSHRSQHHALLIVIRVQEAEHGILAAQDRQSLGSLAPKLNEELVNPFWR